MSNLLLVLINVLLVCSVSCHPCQRFESVDITSGVTFENGSIIHEGTEYTNASWYEIQENNETITLGCPCLFRSCMWKCCNRGQAFSGRNCTDVDLVALNPFSPPMFKDTEPLDMEAHQHFFYMYNNALCIDRYLIDTSNDGENFYIQQVGTTHVIYLLGAVRNTFTVPVFFKDFVLKLKCFYCLFSRGSLSLSHLG